MFKTQSQSQQFPRVVYILTAMDAHERPLNNKLHWWLVTSQMFVRYWRLMTRKIAVLFCFNRGIRPFYAACCFGELSRWSVLCLLNVSSETAISQRHNLIFYAKMDDHGVHRDNTGRILAWLQHPVASKVALDLLYWVMRSASYRLIRMAIEMASIVGAFVCCRRFFHLTNHSKITKL